MTHSTNSSKVLVVVAHPDDAEICMGMRIKKYVELGSEVKIVVLSKGGRQGSDMEEIRVKECIGAGSELGLNENSYIFGDFPDTKLHQNRNEIRQYLEKIIGEVAPDTVFTHFPHDYHLDHQITSEEAVVSARSVPNIYYFRSPYSISFEPNCFFFGSEELYDYKHKALLHFKSQKLLNPILLKKFSNSEYLGKLHPSLLANLFQKYGTQDLYYEPFYLLHEIL